MNTDTILNKVSKLGKNVVWERDQDMEKITGWARRYNFYISDYQVVSLAVFSMGKEWFLSFSQDETDISIKIESEKEGLTALKNMGIV
jgi:hypothetical protein